MVIEYTSNDVSFEVPSAIDVYNGLELARTIQESKQFPSTDEYMGYVMGTSDELDETIDLLQNELEIYKEIGFEEYVEQAKSLNRISANLKDWLISFKIELSDFLVNENPTQVEFENYFQDESNFLFQDDYSEQDVKVIETVLASVEGAGKYRYIHYDDGNNGFLDGDALIRKADCDIVEGLLCTLLLVAIFAVILAVFVAIFLAASLIVFNGEVTDPGTAATAVTLLLFGFALESGALVGFYEWCCGEKIPVVCEEPIGGAYRILDCNQYEYWIYGASNYLTTSWVNLNVNPGIAVTATPELVLSVVSPGELSAISAEMTCINFPEGEFETPIGSVDNFSFQSGPLVFEVTGDFEVEWISAPPATIYLSEINTPDVFISVSPSDNAVYSHSWAITNHEINGNVTGALIELDFNQLGPFTTTVVITNLCTEESQTISQISYLLP